MTDDTGTVTWSGSLWRTTPVSGGFVRLTRVHDGPGALAAQGDSLLCTPSILD